MVMEIPQSTFHKAVCLQDWWLVRSEIEIQGKTLAVAGLTAEHPVRVFSSAPIIKRHDLFTVETADGISVQLNGTINRSRMDRNDFDPKVLDHFFLGFPYNWEDFNDQQPEKELTRSEVSCSSSGPSNKQHYQRGEFKVSQVYSCKETRIRKHEDSLLLCNGEYSSDVGLNGVFGGLLSVATEHPDISERSDHDNSKLVETETGRVVACSIKSDAGNATTLVNLGNRKGKSLTTESGVKNGSGDSIIIPKGVENRTSQHQAHGCVSNESARRKSEKIVRSLTPRRSSRLNDLNKTVSMLETKSEKLKNVSFDSNVLNSISTCNGAIQKQNPQSAMNTSKSRKQREPSRSSVLPDDSNSNNNVEILVEREETHETERELSQKRRKEKPKYGTDVSCHLLFGCYSLLKISSSKVSTPMHTYSRRKSISSVSPVSVSYKRSRSGRLLLPPLEFWRNEQVVYDTDGQITGIMPMVESRKGNASEAQKKKKKFI